MMKRYEVIIACLTRRSKTHIHSKSLKNFIVHIDSIQNHEQRQVALDLIQTYLTTIENNIDEIDRLVGRSFFLDYINSLGQIYRKTGFIKIVHLRFALMLSLPFDAIVGVIFFGFPYPILSSLILIKECIKRIKHNDPSKYYCMFY